MALIASLLVVTACSSSTPTKTFSMGHGSPTFRYPSDWHAAAKPLAKNESSKQVGAFATFELPVNARACGDYPVTAFERVGPTDAIVVVLEQPRVDAAPPLPSDVLGAIEKASFGEGPGCPPVPPGGMVWPEHVLFFSKDGRRFIADVTFGDNASQRTKKRAAGILSSLSYVR